MRYLSYAMALVIFIVFSLASVGIAKEIKINIGHEHNTESIAHTSAVKFAEKIEELSNGEISVKVHPAGALGKEKYLYEQLQRGALDITFGGYQLMELFVPQLKIVVLPGVFEDLSHMTKVLAPDSPFFAKYDELAQEQGFKLLAFGGHMFKNLLMRDEPIYTLEDIKELKLRISESPVMEKATKALGASPVVVPWGELYTALQLGSVDGAGVSPPNVKNMGFYEVADYLSLYNFFPISHQLFYSKDKWDKLSSEHQEAITEAAKTFTDVFNNGTKDQMGFVKYATEGLTDLEDRGMTINEVQEKDKFNELVMEVTNEYIEEDEDVKELYDMIQDIK